MSKSVGKSVIRVDAYEKATGRAKYTDDLCDRSALVAKICHSTIARLNREFLSAKFED